jgi:hypothetical protein
MIWRTSWALSTLLGLICVPLLGGCGVRSLNTLRGDVKLTGDGAVTIHDNGVDVITVKASHGNSLDAADGNPTDALYVDNEGRVGIGTRTPAEPLTVNGMIHTTSGGIKFPDGTVQTSAAISNYQRVATWAPGGVRLLQPGEVVSVAAQCPQGTRVLGGGGGFHQHSGPIAIIGSTSYSNGTQWIVYFQNVGITNGSADLYSEAICAVLR